MSKEVKISAEANHTRRNLWPRLYILFLAGCGMVKRGEKENPNRGNNSGKKARFISADVGRLAGPDSVHLDFAATWKICEVDLL